MKKMILILCPLLAFMLNSCYQVSDIGENVPKITDIIVKDITEDSFYFEAHYTGLHVNYDWNVTYIFKVSEYETMTDCLEYDLVDESYEIYETGYLYGTIRGLKPGTEYWYQFVLTDGLAVVESDIFSLHTLKPEENGGDDGGNDDGGSTDTDEYTMDEALTLSDGTYVELMGVVAAVTQRGFLLSDDDADMLYVYAGAGWTCTVDVGDKVLVDGTMATFHDNRELSMNGVEVYGTASVPYTSAYTLTEDNLGGFAWSGHEPLKIQVTGELIKDGSYYEVKVGESPIVVSLTYPVIDMDYYVGEYVTVTGYYIWTSTSSSYETVVSIILTDISVTDRPGPDPIDTSSASDLNAGGESANCYVVSNYGTYKFDAVKGNSSESVGSVSSVEVLWESFGTSVTPEVGDLIETVEYRNSHVYFRTAPSYREGNAVIAAKNSSGTILWSWHIWLTDQPEEQVYYNNAGTMMDRNLGATSATPGDVAALGLFYQWGRKDPFLGSSSISESVAAKSTLKWPSPIESTEKCDIPYSIKNPTTFIYYSDYSDGDWLYPENGDSKLYRWSTHYKTIYDPCPAGWQVPKRGSYSGVWAKATGYDESGSFQYNYDYINEGMDFSYLLGPYYYIWYPAAGVIGASSAENVQTGENGIYWSGDEIPLTSDWMEVFKFNNEGDVWTSYMAVRAVGGSVRCYKSGSGKSDADSGTEDIGDSEYEW